MTSILATGFTPFDGRDVNASWIAARLLAEAPDVTSMEIPVVWGAPMQALAPLFTTSQQAPSAVISLGEGRDGWFDIETRARNERSARPDNNQELPNPSLIVDAGPDHLDATVSAGQLQRALASSGFPTRVSTDAGAFLCEEMLYTLEILRRQNSGLRLVTFVHLPPYGTALNVDGTSTRCDDALLGRFARTLLAAVRGQLTG